MLRKTSVIRLLFIVAGILCFQIIFAQTKINSPYSYFGIGDITEDFNLNNILYGKAGIAVRSNERINIKNPASYTAFDTTSFLFEFSLISRNKSLVSIGEKKKSNYAALGSILFGFPVAKWWGTSFGIVPYSQKGYYFKRTGYDAYAGNIDYKYEGAGGINKIYIGNGFNIKNTSIGFQASYLFGKMEKVHSAIPDSGFNIKYTNRIIPKDFLFSFGLQQTINLKNDLILTAGATFQPRQKINALNYHFSNSFTTSADDYEFFKDTVVEFEEKTSFTLPYSTGIGLGIEKRDKWMVAMDYSLGNWSEFLMENEKIPVYTDSRRFSAGLQFTPDKNAPWEQYFQKVNYFLGFNAGNTHLLIDQEQINQYGISFGLGLPLRGNNAAKMNKSMLNIGAEMGQRGKAEGNLIKEQYFNLFFSLSLYERWFVKPKYY